MTLREILAVRNEALLAVTSGYHSRRRTVPMSPQELEAVRRRRVRQVVAGVVAGLSGESAPPEASTMPVVYNRRPYPCYLCPDPACPANLPGHQLFLRARYWGKPQEPPRCQRCGREQVVVGPGERKETQ